MKQSFALFIFCLYFTTASAQECTCRQLFDSLTARTEADYAGYVHKVVLKKDAKYDAVKKRLRERSANTSYLDCYDVLSSYLRYFKDEHLFIAEFPRANARQSDSLAPLHPRFDLSSRKSSRNPDPIEGLWQDADQQLEIVAAGRDHFFGVVTATKLPRWQPGFIRMELTRTGPNEYNIRHYNNNLTSARFTGVKIYKRLLLGYGMQKFVKLDAADPESKYIHADHPEQPFFKVIDKDNVLVTVPSALINGNILDSILMSHKAELFTAKNFILDLRGNRGGNFMWKGVYMLANTKSYPAPKIADKDEFEMLASEDNAVYFNRFKSYVANDKKGVQFYTDLNEKIKSNLGKIIGFSLYNDGSDTARRQVFPNPQRVAVIIDKGVASAAEAVIQWLQENSAKLTLYGENTSGMIDYVNVNTIPFAGAGNNRYYFGYPTFYSPTILTNPVNPTGIKPDVYIPSSSRDWIQWVIDDLKNKTSR